MSARPPGRPRKDNVQVQSRIPRIMREKLEELRAIWRLESVPLAVARLLEQGLKARDLAYDPDATLEDFLEIFVDQDDWEEEKE